MLKQALLLLVATTQSKISDDGIKITNSEHKAYLVSDEIDRTIKIDASAPIVKFQESHSDCTATRKNLTILYLNEINKLYSEWLNIEHVQIEDLDSRYLTKGKLNLLQTEELVNITSIYFLKNEEVCINSECEIKSIQESIINELAHNNGYSPTESECASESEISLEYTLKTSDKADSILLDVKSVTDNNLKITADKRFEANFILEKNGHSYYHLLLPEAFQETTITFDIADGSKGHADHHNCRSFKIYNIEAIKDIRSLTRTPRGLISGILAVSALSSEFFAYQKLSSKIADIHNSMNNLENVHDEVSRRIFSNSISISELVSKECTLEKTISEEKFKNVIYNSFRQYREELSDLLLSIQTKTPGNIAHRLLVDLCSEENSDLNACKLFFHEQNYHLINISAIKKHNTIKISLYIHFKMPILSEIKSVKTIKSIPVPFRTAHNLYEYRQAIIPESIGSFQNYTFSLDNCKKNYHTIFCKFEDLNLVNQNLKCLKTIQKDAQKSNNCFKNIQNPEKCLFKISRDKVYVSHFEKPIITSLQSKFYPSRQQNHKISNIGITELNRDKQKLLLSCGQQKLTFLGLKNYDTEFELNIEPIYVHTNISLNISNTKIDNIYIDNTKNFKKYNHKNFVGIIIIVICFIILSIPITLTLIYKLKCSRKRIARSTLKTLEARRSPKKPSTSSRLKSYFGRNKIVDTNNPTSLESQINNTTNI